MVKIELEEIINRIEPDFESLVNALSVFFQKHFPKQEISDAPSSEIQFLITLITGLVHSRMGLTRSGDAQLFTYIHNHIGLLRNLEE